MFLLRISLLLGIIFLTFNNTINAHPINNAVTETQEIICNLVRNHPYISSLCAVWLLRYCTCGHPRDDYRHDICSSCGLDRDTWWYRALLVGVLLDLYGNRYKAVPCQCFFAVRDAIKTYSTSTNDEFFKKSVRWITERWNRLTKAIS